MPLPGHADPGEETGLVVRRRAVLPMQVCFDAGVKVAFREIDFPVARPGFTVRPQQPGDLVPMQRIRPEPDGIPAVQLSKRSGAAMDQRHGRRDQMHAAFRMNMEIQNSVGDGKHPGWTVEAGPVVAPAPQERPPSIPVWLGQTKAEE